MKNDLRPNDIGAHEKAYVQAKALQPVIDKALLGLPPAARHLMECAIPLRPVSWWNPIYIQQLRNMCEAIYLVSFYHRKEMDAAHADDLTAANKYNRLASSKIPMIRAMQVTLQLTPSSLHGQASQHAGSSEIAQEVHQLLTDVNDLYAA
jgi:hypothetical protein